LVNWFMMPSNRPDERVVVSLSRREALAAAGALVVANSIAGLYGASAGAGDPSFEGAK
jgi:hypothetical protein